MSRKSFATAINCMDGRTQIPVIEFMRKKFRVDFVDTITEAGPDKILAENKDHATVTSIKKRVEISAVKHRSKAIAVVGHHDCAGNPVDKDSHVKHIKAAMKTVRAWGYNIEIVGLWVDEDWKVAEIK